MSDINDKTSEYLSQCVSGLNLSGEEINSKEFEDCIFDDCNLAK